MATYRLYFFQPRSHGLVRFADFEAASDAHARDLALERRGELALELWNDRHKLAEIDPVDLAARLIILPQEVGLTQPSCV